MPVQLTTHAEQLAKDAESLPAFSGVNLLHIKRQLAELLQLIGRNGIFDEYTKHDISHVDAMLAMLDWLIPDFTKKRMSPADWLITVLAIYLHDLGMLVTGSEYRNRAASAFPTFVETVLLQGPDGADYHARVHQLGRDAADRFLYQEFVRHHHATRIRAWIQGSTREHLGISHDAIGAITELLAPLGPQFRRDLALVCESHHLNDLGDTAKYRTSQPYGNSGAETANLQYAAVLLRTTDLLHMTSDRTPSIAFRTINPTDPLSQREWARQMAVKRIRPKMGLNDEGVADETAPRDTIEIFAFFTNPDGFFGLTSFINYALSQLRQSHEWITHTRRTVAVPHEFPWRKIDDTNVEAEGFLPEKFEFTLDQAKILDLLTGHTLYNDTNVVLRELVQNALDAVRLQSYPNRPDESSQVAITWDSRTRVLTVADNGTGMTQEIISTCLLKVGSSRYQDPEFKKRYPDFSPISRFGIGVLSTFMIADSVQITTCHPQDDQARELTLRSVHGRYLIRLFDKDHADVTAVAPHGTVLRLVVRPSVSIPDVLETARYWVVVPACRVTVSVDGGTPIAIGYDTPRHAVLSALRQFESAVDDGEGLGPPQQQDKHAFRVIERTMRPVTLAYAVEWSPYFREWSYCRAPMYMKALPSTLFGTCIEGIRVDRGTPGFGDIRTIALANVSGSGAPSTNVARSGLEASPERDGMLFTTYSLLLRHVTDEMRELHERHGFSLTWAAYEAGVLLTRLTLSEDTHPALFNGALFERALAELPIILVEEGEKRAAKAATELVRQAELWTIDSALLQSAESLIREVASDASLAEVTAALKVPGFEFPKTTVLCSSRGVGLADSLVLKEKEVDRVIIDVDRRRVDLRWVDVADAPRWVRADGDSLQLIGNIPDFSRLGFSKCTLVGKRDIAVVGGEGTSLVRTGGKAFILPGTAAASRAAELLERLCAADTDIEDRALCAGQLCVVFDALSGRDPRDAPERIQDLIGKVFEKSRLPYRWRHIASRIDVDNLAGLYGTSGGVFDVAFWRRRDMHFDT